MIVLDVPVEVGLSRATGRAGGDTAQDRFDSESTAFHNAVREGFLALARREPARFAVVDGSKSPEEVTESILEAIHERLAII